MAFDEQLMVFEHMFDVAGIIDHDCRWKRRNGYLIGVESVLALALTEPFEELVSRLEEPKSITDHGKSTGWTSKSSYVTY